MWLINIHVGNSWKDSTVKLWCGLSAVPTLIIPDDAVTWNLIFELEAWPQSTFHTVKIPFPQKIKADLWKYYSKGYSILLLTELKYSGKLLNYVNPPTTFYTITSKFNLMWALYHLKPHRWTIFFPVQNCSNLKFFSVVSFL